MSIFPCSTTAPYLHMLFIIIFMVNFCNFIYLFNDEVCKSDYLVSND